MQLTESLILLPDWPCFLIVEAYLNEIFSVSSMIIWIFHYYCVFDFAAKSHLEEVRTTEIVEIFRASFHVLQKDLCWIEWMTKLALTRHAMLEAFREHFQFLHFLRQFIAPAFLLGHSFAQHLIGVLQGAQLLQLIWLNWVTYITFVDPLSLWLCVVLISFFMYGSHQLFMHLPIFFKLLLSEFQMLLKMLLFFSPLFLLFLNWCFIELHDFFELCFILSLQLFYISFSLFILLLHILVHVLLLCFLVITLNVDFLEQLGIFILKYARPWRKFLVFFLKKLNLLLNQGFILFMLWLHSYLLFFKSS